MKKNIFKVKTISDSFIYNKSYGYGEILTDAIMEAERIDKNTNEFVEDVVIDVKKTKIPSYILTILTSSNSVLMWPRNPLPKPLRTFVAIDTAGSKKLTAFIDCSGVIAKRGTFLKVINKDVLIADLLSAKHNMMYYKLPGVFTKSSSNVLLYTTAFAKLMTHVVDYLGNISVIPGNREKMLYIASMYFLNNVLCAGYKEDKCIDISVKVSGIKDDSKLDACNIMIYSVTKEKTFTLQPFFEIISKTFNLPKLTMTLGVEKWMMLYGAGTVLSLEFLPSFLTMLTDSYCGAYTNNQKMIEKILGTTLTECGKSLIYDTMTKI